MTLKQMESMHGFGKGDHVALFRRVDNLNWEEVSKILLSYSCYKPALPKIKKLLEDFGRYDCILQPGWFRSQYINVREDLKKVGIELQVVSMTILNRNPLASKLR